MCNLINTIQCLGKLVSTTGDTEYGARYIRYQDYQNYIHDFHVRHSRCVDRITSIDKCNQTQLLIFVLLRSVLCSILNNDMFRLLYWPSSGCTSLLFEANYTIHNVFVNDKNIVYCIVCFENKKMYNLMMADIAAVTCHC